MNTGKRITSLLFTVLIITALVIPGFGDNGTVTYVGDASSFVFLPGSGMSPTELFPDLKNVMPGDSVKQQILLENSCRRGKSVKLYMKSYGAQEGTDKFLSQMKLTVKKNGTSPLFEAPSNETAQLTDWVYLGTVKYGGSMTLDLTLEVPITMGNEYMNAVGYIDWEFKAEELDDSTNPKTGDESSLPLYIVLSGVSLTGLILLVRKRK